MKDYGRITKGRIEHISGVKPQKPGGQVKTIPSLWKSIIISQILAAMWAAMDTKNWEMMNQ